jgi:hypothetical protein
MASAYSILFDCEVLATVVVAAPVLPFTVF